MPGRPPQQHGYTFARQYSRAVRLWVRAVVAPPATKKRGDLVKIDALYTVLGATVGPVLVALLFFVVFGWYFRGRTVCEHLAGKKLQCQGGRNGRFRWRWR